jgi:thymidine kinase
VEVDSALDIRAMVVERLSAGARIDYLICDEAQFYAEEQIDQLAAIVDELAIDVYAFGIMTDFRTRLFPGSARLVELSDRVQVLQVEALCWCGARAIHNARTVNGEMVVEGSQVMVGDTNANAADHVAYEVLCRTHYRARMTATHAQGAHMSPQPLPFGDA